MFSQYQKRNKRSVSFLNESVSSHFYNRPGHSVCRFVGGQLEKCWSEVLLLPYLPYLPYLPPPFLILCLYLSLFYKEITMRKWKKKVKRPFNSINTVCMHNFIYHLPGAGYSAGIRHQKCRVLGSCGVQTTGSVTPLV